MCEGCGCHVLESIYQPLPAKVIQCVTASQEYSRVTCAFDKDLKIVPGQYMLASVPGFPEVVLDVCVATDGDSTFDLFIHKSNMLHNAIAKCNVGDVVSIRGPFGKGLDVTSLNNQDICFVVDEKGFSPIRSVLLHVLTHWDHYGKVMLCVPENVLDDDIIAMCAKSSQVQILNIDDKKPIAYQTVFSKMKNERIRYIIAIPTLSIGDIVKADFIPQDSFRNAFISLSHLIHCGVGTCGHCNTGALCVCTEGPFFCLDDIRKNMGSVHI